MSRNRKRKNEKSFLEKIIEKERINRKNDKSQLRSLDKSTMNKRVIYVMVFFIVIFLSLVFYLVYFQLFRAEKVVQNDYNKRFWVDENAILRGNIFDRNGNLIAYTEKDENGYSYRVYNYGIVDAAFTGFNSIQYGKSGLEKSYNNELLNLPDKPISKFRDMVEKTGYGNNLNLSIDQRIQDLAYNYLQGHTGSIVVMNPRSGEVLAMVSNPSFDPNTLDSDWQDLVQNGDGPLLNRVTQGVYRPGSIFKIITSAAILENNIDQNYKDTGTETIQGYDLKNFDDQVFGEVNLRSAFINSINTYFAAKTNAMGKDLLKESTDDFLFDKKIDFDLELISSKIPYENLNKVDLAMTGFGYGKTQVTPLHMAMMTSAIANEGKMMRPILVSSVVDRDGKTIKKQAPEVLSEAVSPLVAEEIRDLMIGVVNEGTASRAYLDGIQIAGKTGTADRENGTTDTWFVGFAPAYDPQIAIAIVFEKDGLTAGESTAPVAGALINDIISTVDF